MSENNKNDKPENPRTAEKIVFCCECENSIKSAPESYENQVKMIDFLKKHQNHVKLIGTKEQINESSYFLTTKGDMKLTKKEYADFLERYVKDIFDEANKK